MLSLPSPIVPTTCTAVRKQPLYLKYPTVFPVLFELRCRLARSVTHVPPFPRLQNGILRVGPFQLVSVLSPSHRHSLLPHGEPLRHRPYVFPVRPLSELLRLSPNRVKYGRLRHFRLSDDCTRHHTWTSHALGNPRIFECETGSA